MSYLIMYEVFGKRLKSIKKLSSSDAEFCVMRVGNVVAGCRPVIAIKSKISLV